MALPDRTRPDFSVLGTLNQPSVGRVDGTLAKGENGVYRMDLTFKGARISVTDGAGSGSHGSYKFFDFNEGAVSFLGCRQDYTRFAEGSALTTAAGDAVFEIGIGTTAIAAAADGTLGNGVNENVGQAVALTNSSGTSAGTAVDGAKTTALNGTGTALDLNMNWSGTAATIDASSTIDVWGTVSITFAWMGDD